MSDFPTDPVFAHEPGPYGWVYRRRRAIWLAGERAAPPGASAAERYETGHRARMQYELPPYPCDKGYRWYRIRDFLGLVKRP